jgi:hypothetical protein
VKFVNVSAGNANDRDDSFNLQFVEFDDGKLLELNLPI